MIWLAAVVVGAAALADIFLVVNLLVFRDLPKSSPEVPGPLVSVIVPARNEERGIERAVRAHLESRGVDVEVIVVDDRSTDRTAEILGRIARESPRLRVIAGVEPPDGWLGKPHALREGVAAAAGEWLLLADADVVYAPDTLRRALDLARSERIDFLALLPRFEAGTFWEAVLMPELDAALFLAPAFLAQMRRFRRLALGAGAGNLVRRDVYLAAGGHAAIPAAVIDDVRLAVLVKRAGYRVRAAAAFDGVSVRMYEGFSEVVEGFTKNLAYATTHAATLGIVLALFLFFAVGPYVLLALNSRGPAARLCIAAIGLTLAGRVATDLRARNRWWSGFFHPIMMSVWVFIGLRSLARRVIGGRIDWRGRTRPSSLAR